MSTSRPKDDETPPPPKSSTVLLLLGTIGDTTWRMFAPTITGIAGGYTLDATLHTGPWLFITGIVLGSLIAGLLIKQQLQKKI